MSTPEYPTMAELVNELFRTFRHPDGREYTHKEVEEGITKAAGRKLIDASYLSRLRTGALQKPSAATIEALCYFFPVETDYFFPRIAAFRHRQSASVKQNRLIVALRAIPDMRDHLAALLDAIDEEAQDQSKERGKQG